MAASIKASFTASGDWIARLHWRIFPPRCLVCAGEGTGRRDLCSACALELPRLGSCCQCCAEPLSRAGLCGRCLRVPPLFDQVSAPFLYAPSLDRLIKAFKFDGQLEAGRLLADLMADFLTDVLDGQERPQALLPVPLHPNRWRERGYNQALELARPIAQRLGIRLLPNALQRLRDTPQQAQLALPQRQRNIRAAFAVPQALALQHIAIIDDVMTTGSTANEIARVLRAAGVKRVQVWVCARVVLS